MNSSSTSSSSKYSDSKFFRFGRFSKASRKSSSGYSNQSFSQTENEEDVYSEIYQLGQRSASLSTLPSSMPSAAQIQLEEMRIAQLQSLEAKMASIAVSLTNAGGRRLSTAGYAQVIQGPAVSSSGSSAGSAVLSSATGQRGLKQLRSEIDILRKIICDKDVLIRNLRDQLVDKQHSSIQHAHSRMVSNANERLQLEQRLNCLNREIEAKKVVIKNLQIALQHTDLSDNIDARIRQAELEYQLEREETNVLNLQEEKRAILLKSCGSEWPQKSRENPSLFKLFSGSSPALVFSCTVSYDAEDPPFMIQQQTCKICSVKEGLPVQSGDRVLEVNGVVVDNGKEAMSLLKSGRLEMVVSRSSQEESLKEELAELSTKCDKLVREKDTIKTENLRLKHRISYLEESREELTSAKTIDQRPSSIDFKYQSIDNPSVYRSEVQVHTMPVRQKPPRTSKLNKQPSSVQDRYHADGSAESIAAHYKRPHSSLDHRKKTPIGSDDAPKLPTIDRHYGHVIRVTHHHHPHDTRQSNTPESNSAGRPSSPTESEVFSVASADDRRHLGYISDDLTNPASYNGTGTRKPKPVPPRKPSFLYLNRASSLQSVTTGTNNSLERPSMNRYQRPSLTDGTDTESESVTTDNNRWPRTNKSSFSLSGNLKWPLSGRGSNKSSQ